MPRYDSFDRGFNIKHEMEKAKTIVKFKNIFEAKHFKEVKGYMSLGAFGPSLHSHYSMAVETLGFNPSLIIEQMKNAHRGRGQPEALVHLMSYTLGKRILDNGFISPFYVTKQMVEALIHTKIPEGFVLSDINRPLDDMVFVIEGMDPAAGIIASYEETLDAFIIMTMADTTISGIPKHDENDNSRVVISLVPCNIPLEHSLSFAKDVRLKGTATQVVAPLAKSLVASLIMAMNAHPDYLVGHQRGPQKPLPPDAPRTWSPNYVNTSFQIKNPHQGGSHRSPVMHIRKGHFRTQRIGQGRKLKKLNWIRPTLVNSESLV